MFLSIIFASSACEFKDSLPVFGSAKEQRKNESHFPGSLTELQLTLFLPEECKGTAICICKKCRKFSLLCALSRWERIWWLVGMLFHNFSTFKFLLFVN